MSTADLSPPVAPVPVLDHEGLDHDELARLVPLIERLQYIEATAYQSNKRARKEARSIRFVLSELLGVELPPPPLSITGAEVYVRTAAPPSGSNGSNGGGR
jgi:hypothetical protein